MVELSPDPDEGMEASASPLETGLTSSTRSSSRLRWARLLARIYEVLPLLCTGCGGELRILPFLTDEPEGRNSATFGGISHRVRLDDAQVTSAGTAERRSGSMCGA